MDGVIPVSLMAHFVQHDPSSSGSWGLPPRLQGSLELRSREHLSVRVEISRKHQLRGSQDVLQLEHRNTIFARCQVRWPLQRVVASMVNVTARAPRAPELAGDVHQRAREVPASARVVSRTAPRGSGSCSVRTTHAPSVALEMSGDGSTPFTTRDRQKSSARGRTCAMAFAATWALRLDVNMHIGVYA